MKPTRTKIGSVTEDSREEHPAYAMVGASRVTGAARLAGSDFRHQNYIVITLRDAHLSRGLSNDRWFGDKTIAKFALSEAQWATFVSSLNVGFGVPCTLEYTKETGYVPRIEPLEDRTKVFRGEVIDTMQDALASLKAAHDGAPTKKMKGLIANAMQEIRSNIPFVAQQFDEHMEQTTEKAKIEINAYATSVIQRAGIASIAENEGGVVFLDSHSEESVDNNPAP